MGKDNKIIVWMVLMLGITIPGISMLAVAPAADAVRTLSTANPTPDSTFNVMLEIKGFLIGGLVETIPEGFVFVSTTHPSNQTYKSGQKVVFAMINETSINYVVRAPTEGSGTFNGIWYDALNGTTGDIKQTEVSVRIAGTPKPTPGTAATPSPSTPGFKAVLVLTGLLAIAYLLLLLRRRRGNFKGGDES
ncbi:MAG: hypothetical protein WAV32_03125 [Halobacteriota archaeon]